MHDLKSSLDQCCRDSASLRLDAWGGCWRSPAGREVAFFHFLKTTTTTTRFHWNINYAPTRTPVNIGVKPCKGCPKTEAWGGIGGEKLPVPEETWPRCGSGCSAWARMHPNFSSWLLIRNWWWSAPRNGKFYFFIVSRLVTGVQLLKPHEKCVSVGMLSSFMVTHTQCWCAGMSACWEGSLVKLLCFFLLLRQSCLDLMGKHSTSTPKAVFPPKEGKTKCRIQRCCWGAALPSDLTRCLKQVLHCISFLFCETILFLINSLPTQVRYIEDHNGDVASGFGDWMLVRLKVMLYKMFLQRLKYMEMDRLMPQ